MISIRVGKRAGTPLLAALIALAVTVMATPLQAEPRSVQDVAQAVETWLGAVISDARPDARVLDMAPHPAKGAPAAYVVQLADGGYCLAGADDLLLPVYLYVPAGNYDDNDPDVRFVLDEMVARLHTLREALERNDPRMAAHRSALADRAATWWSLVAGLAPTSAADDRDRTAPVMMRLPQNSKWHQRPPYKDQNPGLPGEVPAKVGCVATAMSQILYYWQWPPTGEGSNSREYWYSWRSDWDSEPLATDPVIDPGFWAGRLRWLPDGGGSLEISGHWDRSWLGKAKAISLDETYRATLTTLYDRMTLETVMQTADFAATNYELDQLHDDHTDPPGIGDFEVAQLCYHVGISINTYWGQHISTAAAWEAENALVSYFRYDPDTVLEPLDIDRLTEEIQWLRPVLLEGVHPGGGAHAYLAAGYDMAPDPYRLFWINLGWGGGGAWYTIDSVDIGYVVDQHHVTRVAPEGVVQFAGGGAAGDGTPDTPYADLLSALAVAPAGVTLILEAGSVTNLSGASAVLDQPVILKGQSVVIQGQ
jgi:hypothetical protein